MRWLVAAALVCACGTAPAPQPELTGDLDLEEPQHAPRSAPRTAPPEQVAPPPSPRARQSVRSPRQIWRGRRIDLDVRNADLENLYRFLAEVGGINIVIAPDVSGQVTLKLRSVPWDQIAHVVARSHGLEIERDGRIWLVRKKSAVRR